MAASLELFGVRVALALSRGLSETSVARLGRGLGRLALGFGVRRRVARENLSRAFAYRSADELRSLERRVYEHAGQILFEFLSLPRRDAVSLRAHVEIAGREYADAALAHGRGAIVASGHTGNWEVCAAGCAAHGLPMAVVVQAMSNAAVGERIQAVRRGAGIDVLDRGMALRRVRAALGANKLVFLMCDQDARRHGVFVPFFGVPASTPKGAAQMAIRFGVPFLTAFSSRLHDGRHRLTFGAPIEPQREMQESEAIVDVLQQFNRRLETAIGERPDQYWWVHRRWKTRAPAGLVPVTVMKVSKSV